MSFISFASFLAKTLSTSTVFSDSQFSTSLTTPKIIYKQVPHITLTNFSFLCLNSSPLLCAYTFWPISGKESQVMCKYAYVDLLLTSKFKQMKAEGFLPFLKK